MGRKKKDTTNEFTFMADEATDWVELIKEYERCGANYAVVIGLSAGKDSTAVALRYVEEFPGMLNRVHFVFADTGSELPETYEYLDRLEKHFNKPVLRLKSKMGELEEIISKFNGYLPSPMSRYCTRMSKIVPFRDYMDDLAGDHDVVLNMVGIRADEPSRTGYQPCGQYADRVKTIMPLQQDNMNLHDVFEIVKKYVGLPDYYRWRTRSGCYFCFYQRRIEWVNLMREHPDLFEKAKQFEKTDPETGKRFTWIKDLPLEELEKRADKIKSRYKNTLKNKKKRGEELGLTDAQLFEELMQELEPENKDSCSICR